MENYQNQENSAFANAQLLKGQVTTNFEGKPITRKLPNTDRMRSLVKDETGKNVDHNPPKAKLSMWTRFAIAISKKIRLILTDGKEDKAMRGPYAHLARQGTTGPGKRLLDFGDSKFGKFEGNIEDLTMAIDSTIKPHELVRYTNENTGTTKAKGNKKSTNRGGSIISTRDSQKRKSSVGGSDSSFTNSSSSLS
jgi:hypothetical protein